MASLALEVYNKIKAHLESYHFKFNAHDDDMAIDLIYVGHDLPQPTIIHVLEDRNVVQIISPIPGQIPEEKRIDAAVAAHG